jgi:hypothetical protein
MHWIGLYIAYREEAVGPWWRLAVFIFAGIAYPLSALAILKQVRAGLWVALLGPAVGFTLHLIGLLFPATGLTILLPGTLDDEMTTIGFLTLVFEPMAVVLASETLIESSSQL